MLVRLLPLVCAAGRGLLQSGQPPAAHVNTQGLDRISVELRVRTHEYLTHYVYKRLLYNPKQT